MLPGVFRAVAKDKTDYYRASITFIGKHISLGSFPCESDAHQAYLIAGELLNNTLPMTIDNYPDNCILSYNKWITLHNLRDNRIYFKNPIYIKKNYFLYYVNPDLILKFDADDLFYYAHHKILKRGNHLFVSDFGMQVSIFSRYGIKNYSIPGRDFIFSNGDCTDYRYRNIEIINHYYGVTKVFKKGRYLYLSKIHINGYFIIGCYPSEEEAAIAYNKAIKLLHAANIKKNYQQNFIEGIDEIAYASLYQKVKISKKLIAYINSQN